jgi:hypothetical protein
VGDPPAQAATLHPELGFAVRGLLGLGDLGSVSKPSLGGDAALRLGRGGGLGLRAAAGLHSLERDKIPTGGTNIFGSPNTFSTSQDIWWAAIGPAWSRPVGSGRVDFYLMAGRAHANASSSGEWIDNSYLNITRGSDPGATHVSLAVVGAAWSPPRGPLGTIELGAELFAGGRAAFWANPPAVVDSAGNHVRQSRTAQITGVVFRAGFRFGGPPRKK